MIESITERFGLPATVISAIAEVFSEYQNIDTVLLYGSRAKGTHRRGSDIDLTIIGSEPTEEQRLQIESRLDDLLLPYSIDLSLMSSITNQPLLDHIHRVGIPFYAKGTSG